MRKLKLTKALKNALPYVLTLILVGIMTFVAEILGEGEIIFPEITALAIGYMVTQKQGWKVNDSRMIALIAICAVAGVLTVRYIKVGLYLEILIAFVFAQILFMLSGTTFAPMISAIVLPVMMQTESFIYPIAAFLLTIAVVLFRRFLLKVKIRDKEDFQSVNLHAKSDVIDTAVRTICVAVVGFFAIWSGFKFAIAPPLLVAFTEFSRPKNKARKDGFGDNSLCICRSGFKICAEYDSRIAVDSCRIDSHGDNACNCLLHKNVYSACRSIDNFEYDYSE